MRTLHSGSAKAERFASVLEGVRRVAAEREDAPGTRAPNVTFCFASPPDVAETATPGADRWSQAFDWIAPEEPQPQRKPEPKRSDKTEVTPEALGITSDLSALELRRLRRQFARDNYPDRLDPALRETATQRMTLANMLIDAALARKAPK